MNLVDGGRVEEGIVLLEQALAERVLAEWGRVDFLVNNAGSTRGSDRVPALDLPLSEWQRVLSTNLDGTFKAARS